MSGGAFLRRLINYFLGDFSDFLIFPSSFVFQKGSAMSAELERL